MKMAATLFLLFTLGLAAITVSGLTRGIHAGSTCYAADSGSLKLWNIAFNKRAIEDEACQRVEAARLAAEIGEKEMAKAIVCDHPGAKLAFGNETNCVDFSGNYREVIQAVAGTESYCKKRSRKWYKFAYRKRAYRKCMEDRE